MDLDLVVGMDCWGGDNLGLLMVDLDCCWC